MMPSETRSPTPFRYKLMRFAFGLFALEVGVFLLFFPWHSSWTANYLQDVLPPLRDYWNTAYFRGAISGLGLVNLYLAVWEFVQLFRR